jgi:hypothetical protein
VNSIEDAEPTTTQITNIVSAARGTFSATIGGTTSPVAADFTALNAATLTNVTIDIGVGVHTQALSSGSTNTQVMKGGYKAMNYTSGTITLVAGFVVMGTANAYGCSGVFFRESATSKLTTFEHVCIGSWQMQLGGADLSGPAGMTWVRAPAGLTSVAMLNMTKFYMKATYDGTNMKYYCSVDMVNWRLFGTVSKTEYFTTAPDQWGFFCNANTTAGNVDVVCFHWAVS